MTHKTATAPAADICLYGGTHGSGWLARTSDGRMFGNGDPVAGRDLTAATWLAAEALRAAGVRGHVRIFEPSGRSMAIADVGAIPYFGMLAWQAAPVYTISVEALEAAAREQEQR